MSRRLRPAGALAGALVGAAALSGCGLSLQNLPKLSSMAGSTYPVRAVFADVLDLPDDAQVREGAQVVGQVDSISTQDFKADLTLKIKRSVRLPVGTTAQVRFDDPLGDEYVMLQAPPVLESVGSSAAPSRSGRPRFLAAGSVIPERSTSTAPSVEDTFGALSLVLNGGGINQLQTIIHQLNLAFNGNQPAVRSFLVSIDSGVHTLAQGRTSIDGALTALSNLSQELNGGRTTIATGIDAIAPAVRVLAGEDHQFSSLLSRLSDLGAVATTIARESGQNSVADAKALLPVVQQLEGVSAQLAPDLSDLARFEAETPKIAPGDYLQVSADVGISLPAGAFEPTPISSTAATAASVAGGAAAGTLTGRRAVSGLLVAGLS
jgi:phospholipid/cholesterol/gamma-HCH transport system substrate-binding protein